MTSFKRINIQEAKEILNEPESILVDIRDAQSYLNDHDELALHLTENNITRFIADTSKDTPVLVMCYHGNSSQGVADYLAGEGFKNVYSIDGGYELWRKSI